MDRRYVEQEKRFRRKITELAPTIYAAFCIALSRLHGFDFDQILELLQETQTLWHQAAIGEIDIIQQCSDETDIDLMSYLRAKEEGVEGETI